MTDPKIIKRYSNRKLYDTESSSYVTLDEIGRMVKDGVDIKIIDNKSKEDLTSITLTQIILSEEKKTKSILPLSTLRNIIQSQGETLTDFFLKKIAEPVSSIKDGAAHKVDRILKRADSEDAEDIRYSLKDILDSPQKFFDELQHRIDDRFRHAIDGITQRFPALNEDLDKIIQRIDAIEKRIEDLEAK